MDPWLAIGLIAFGAFAGFTILAAAIYWVAKRGGKELD